MPKRVIDKFDMEAEREGAALSLQRKTVCKPFGWNKGIVKQRSMHTKGEKRIECKTIKDRYERGFI